MKRYIVLFASLFVAALWANDSVYFGHGNQLIPLMETDISITREVLTISLHDDGTASVDVWYELDNRGEEKEVLMGFEIDPPYNDGEAINLDGTHPFVKDFRVVLNDQTIPYQTAIVKPNIQEEGIQPIDLSRVINSPEWVDYGEAFVWQKGDSVIYYSSAYYFPALFHRGKNTIHHTYDYMLSYSLENCFDLTYKLTPAMRWANHQIDDFILRIKADHTAKHFVVVNDSLFVGADFHISEGMGKTRECSLWGKSAQEVTLRNGTLEWHYQDFRPGKELNVLSADILYYGDNPCLGFFYDRSKGFKDSFTFQMHMSLDSLEYLSAEKKRILRNLPYAHRGYVFRDRFLRSYFESLWWYMPDPNWQASTEDFTPEEQQLILTTK